jgi:acetolactate synthase-1/2/3 large subunit
LITGYAGRDAAASAAIESLSVAAGIRVIDFLTFTNIGRSFAHFGGFQSDDLADVDVGLLVDVDVPWIPVATRDDPTTFWAQIDVDVLKSASPLWSFPANLRIQGKSSRILTQLTEAIERSATPDFHAAARKQVDKLTAEHKERLQRIAALAADKGRVGEINPHYVCAEIGRARVEKLTAEPIEADDIVVNEAVTRQSIPNMQISRPKPGTMISNAGGGLGASAGTALGVKLALPDRCVVQIVGDGSFYFNNPTAMYALSKQYALPIFTVVLDNSGWAAVKGATLRVYPEGQAKSELFQAILPATWTSQSRRGCGRLWRAARGSCRRSCRHQPMLGGVRAGRSALLHACVTKL